MAGSLDQLMEMFEGIINFGTGSMGTGIDILFIAMSLMILYIFYLMYKEASGGGQ